MNKQEFFDIVNMGENSDKQPGPVAMINVVNYKNHPGGKNGEGELIMRGTPLGNPYPLGKYSREQSLSRYRNWLYNQVGYNHPPVVAELKRLMAIAAKGDLTLICCCKPLACHGDIIKDLLEDWLKASLK